MPHLAPESISSFDSANSDASSIRQFSDSLSSTLTPLSTTPQSSSSSVKSVTHVLDGKNKKSPLKSSLKTSKSASSLTVRFSVPEPLPAMPGLEPGATLSPCKDGHSSPPRTSLDLPAGPPARISIHKRLSAPAPISRRESKTFSPPPIPPSPGDPKVSSTSVGRRALRITSFQSVSSAPAALQSLPSPSDPPSQYNPLQHYVPCLTPKCKNYYTISLLGLTFYSPQQPYQLTRKHGLCPFHAQQDLKLANQRIKGTYESMRQNCGRKTLAAIAAEFEVFQQKIREERLEESERMKEWQRQRVLGSPPSKKGKEKAWEEEWDWRFSPRPCMKKACEKDWYSPFDNRLFLFYTTPRASGLVPLRTLCPSCAKEDVEGAEEKIEGRRRDAGGVVGLEWEEWCVQVGQDRVMEVEFWEGAQEKVVRETMGSAPVIASTNQGAVVKKKKSQSRKKLDVCIVM